MYYWDGKSWVTTLSYDRKHRWNGTSWVPVGAEMGTPSYTGQAGTGREPTSWTRPLQLGVIAYYALTGLYGALAPFFLYGPLRDYLHAIAAQSAQQAQQQNPGASPPDLTPFFDAMLPWMLGFSAVFAVVIAAVVIIGALNRWRWLYYVLLVFLGLGVLGLPFTILNATGVTSLASRAPNPLIGGTGWISVLFSILGAALFVWMLIGLIRRGPWAMRRVQ